MKKRKVLLLLNDTTYAYRLRRELIQRLISEQYEVVAVCALQLSQDEIRAMGCRLIGVENGRQGTNPFKDLWLFMQYVRIIHREKPDVVLSYNIKPNVYGGMACQLLRIRYMPNITGLGTAVEYPGKMQQLTTRLYKWGVAGAEAIFFQNEENLQFFEQRNMMPKRAKVCLLPGSGVNLETHPALPYVSGEVVHFLYVARLLKEKGIELYLSAAKRITQKHPNVMFHICGGCDDHKYLERVQEAQNAGYIQYHGEQKNMIPFFQKAHCVVHPSYYPEGMSNVLLEAAASARPVIATDRSGCRETVDAGKTGYLIPIKDEEALVQALEDFLNLTWEERAQLGHAGRKKMEQEFDRQIVVQKYLNALDTHQSLLCEVSG